MSTEMREKFTVQGGEPLVPVALGGGKAGPTRPLANDCGSSEVRNQVSKSNPATGEGDIDPFTRRDSLKRTPPKQLQTSAASSQALVGQVKENKEGRADGSDNTINVVMSEEEEEDVFSEEKCNWENIKNPKKKRRRADTPEKEEPSKELLELRKIVANLVQSAQTMKSLIASNPNTKMQLKQEVNRIGRTIEVMATKCKEWDTYPRSTTKVGQREVIQTKDVGCQASPKLPLQKKSVGTQLNFEMEIEQEAKELEEIIRTLEEGETLESVTAILDRTWPEDVYKAVKIAKGSPAQAGNDTDIALVIDNNVNNNRGFLKGMITKYPEIVELIEQGMENGQVEYIESITKTKTSRRQAEQVEKYIYLLPLEINPEGVNDIELLNLSISRLRDLNRKNGKKKITVATQEGIDRVYARKLMEHIFRRTGVEVTYLIPEGKGGNIQKHVQNKEEKLLVKKGQMSYADLLKKIKSEVDLKSTGAGVKNIKKTVAGDLLFIVEGGSEKVDALRNEIRAKVQEVTVSERETAYGTCIITGIDEITTDEEIVTEVQKVTRARRSEIKIRSLRIGRFGNQVATIDLPKAQAMELAKRGKINIGWLACKVAEKVEIARCYRCLEFGHRAQGCKNEDRGILCLKCGSEGHRAKECVNPPKCMACNQNNHRADQMKCPQFRKLVEAKRRRLFSQK